MLRRRKYNAFIKVKGDSSLYCIPLTTETYSWEVYSRNKLENMAINKLLNMYPTLSRDDIEPYGDYERTHIVEEGRCIKSVTEDRDRMQWVVEDVRGGLFRYSMTLAEITARQRYLIGHTPTIQRVI